MDTQNFVNDPEHVVEADRAHVWHHLSQHKPYETVDPRIPFPAHNLPKC